MWCLYKTYHHFLLPILPLTPPPHIFLTSCVPTTAIPSPPSLPLTPPPHTFLTSCVPTTESTSCCLCLQRRRFAYFSTGILTTLFPLAPRAIFRVYIGCLGRWVGLAILGKYFKTHFVVYFFPWSIASILCWAMRNLEIPSEYLMLQRHLNSFIWLAIKVPWTRWLVQQEFIFLWFWRLGIFVRVRCWRVESPLSGL